MKRVAFFIPHVGCPRQCSFCNQKSISGQLKEPSLEEVRANLNAVVKSLGDNIFTTEIAFFGGSFTAIPRQSMLGFLNIAKEYCIKENFSAIRFSTRPDAINDEVLDILNNYPISQIELGLQSMNDNVLTLNNRGHLSDDTVKTVKLIQSKGIGLTLQMMVGMYGDTKDGAIETAKKICLLKPSEVRIYPTLVLKDTKLEELFHSGKYTPLSLDEAIDICSQLLKIFEEAGIKVIRLGLHNEEGLINEIVAGPHHPAFRELCEGYNIYKDVLKYLEGDSSKNLLYISPKAVSKLKGHGGWLIKKLEQAGYNIKIKTLHSLNNSDYYLSNSKGD